MLPAYEAENRARSFLRLLRQVGVIWFGAWGDDLFTHCRECGGRMALGLQRCGDCDRELGCGD